MTEPTQEQPQVIATVSPAPPPKSRWHAIPHHLGRARTSTVVLSVLFLAIGALWLNVRPASSGTPADAPVVQQPVGPPPGTPAPAPAPTTDPAPTTSAPPSRTSATPTTTAPESTAPTEPDTRSPATTSETPTPEPSPTVATPTG